MEGSAEGPRLVLGTLDDGGGVSSRTIGRHAAAFVGDDSRLVVVESAGGVETLLSLAAPVTALAVARDGRVALFGAGRRELVLLDPVRWAGVRVALPDDLLTATDVAWTASGDVVVVGMGKEGTKVVRLAASRRRPTAKGVRRVMAGANHHTSHALRFFRTTSSTIRSDSSRS